MSCECASSGERVDERAHHEVEEGAQASRRVFGRLFKSDRSSMMHLRNVYFDRIEFE